MVAITSQVYNEITTRTEWEISKQDSKVKTRRVLKDQEEALLRSIIKMNHKVNITTDGGSFKCTDYNPPHVTWCLLRDSYAMMNKYNPLLSYFQSLPVNNQEAPENFLKILKVEDNAYSRWVQSFIFKAILLRTVHPGMLLRHVPVIIGVPDIGKSAILRHLLPNNLQSYFNDNFSFDLFENKKVEAIMGKLVVELSEMAGSNKAEIARMRAFLTQTHDTFRPAWGKNVLELPRRCLLIGTANKGDQFLPNDDALRARILPINVHSTTGADVETYMEENRDKWWSYIYNTYHSTQRNQSEKMLRLPTSLKPQQQDNNTIVLSDEELDISTHITDYMQKDLNLGTIEFINNYNILGNNRIDREWALKHPNILKPIRAELIKAGLKQKRSNGKTGWRPQFYKDYVQLAQA